MPAEEFAYTLSLDDVDARLLPADARTPGTDAFRAALRSYLEGQYRDFGGRVRIAVDDARREVTVRWSPDPSRPDPQQVVLDRLNRRDYASAVPLLELLRRHEPGNPAHPYNLGMVYSDLGQLERARDLLREALRLDPANVNALVALGVAQVRGGDTDGAVASLTEAVGREPDNPWARRNLGACLLRAGRAAEAEAHLRRAVELQPRDQQAVFGLGQALDALDRAAEADERYVRAIDLDRTSPVADRAKEARSKLAQRGFRERGGGAERMDAVMYLAGALERFEQMTADEVRKVGLEVAVLGMGGIDPNDPAQKYTLQSLPGTFSGLHLLCLMFAAFRRVAPEHQIGFDLAREYDLAVALHAKRKAD
jgi:Flp pilus assembly protein TadD